MHIPVAEAMVMCKGKGSDEESSQIFIPFLSVSIVLLHRYFFFYFSVYLPEGKRSDY